MFRKTMIALAATAAVTGAVASTAEAKKKNLNFDIDINFGGGGYGPDYGYGGGYGGYDDDYCGVKWIKKVYWVNTPWGPKKVKKWKKINTCWY
jgi:hypothetical protein